MSAVLCLMQAWKEEVCQPDPTTLPGLLELAESRLETGLEAFAQLRPAFRAMRVRLSSAHAGLVSLLAEDLPEEVGAAGWRNHQAFQDAEDCLDSLCRLDGDEERHWEALGQLEEVAQALQEASAAVARLARRY
ncbi:MAG: hypothetical protein AB7S38_25955 [Vulcanimicrobiota bacterium]